MEKGINVLLQLYQIGVVINKGMLCLAENPQDMAVKKDVLTGLQVMAAQFQNVRFREIEEEAASFSENSEKERIRRAADTFAETLVESVSEELNQCVEKVQMLGKGQAEGIFQFLDGVPHTTYQVCELYYNVCQKSRISMPRESFLHFLQLLTEQPQLLSGEGSLHPEYAYRFSEQRTFEKCPVCGGDKAEDVYCAMPYTMAHFSYPHLPVKLWRKCEECGNLYTWNFPEEQLALSLHSRIVTPDPEKAWATLPPPSAGILALWSEILTKLRGYTAGNTLLEVGIGNGEMISVALELGFDVDAVEIEPEVAQRVADVLNLPIWAGDFLNYAPEKKYSVLTMGDVLEHVTDPTAALKKAYELLEDDGALWLSTPNYESSFSRMRKYEDAMWCTPEHIIYFSYRGFRTLAQKCGFEVREYSVSRRYNGSMELILTKQYP